MIQLNKIYGFEDLKSKYFLSQGKRIYNTDTKNFMKGTPTVKLQTVKNNLFYVNPRTIMITDVDWELIKKVLGDLLVGKKESIIRDDYRLSKAQLSDIKRRKWIWKKSR